MLPCWNRKIELLINFSNLPRPALASPSDGDEQGPGRGRREVPKSNLVLTSLTTSLASEWYTEQNSRPGRAAPRWRRWPAWVLDPSGRT